MEVRPGQRRTVEIPVARLPSQTMLGLPLTVLNGRHDGPRLWLSAAIHGDELNGVEIIRQVLNRVEERKLRGLLIAAPIVNVFGFTHQSRYLPDRRDLNRSFPGSERGSLASQVARLFMREVVSHCTHGIDLHTGSHHRINLPQIRGNLADEETARCAHAFGAPLILHATTRDGSLRQAGTAKGIPVLLYEAGEPLRFNEDAIETGVDGILRVMSALGMRRGRVKRVPSAPVEIWRSQWLRARHSGIVRMDVKLGAKVRKRQQVCVIADAFGGAAASVRAPADGYIIGRTLNPLVNKGDAVIHLGEI